MIFVFCWVPISAQQEVIYSLHRYHLNIFNPAATGSQGDPFINMSLRYQWVGIEGASEVPFSPSGDITSTDVQAAIQELDTENKPYYPMD